MNIEVFNKNTKEMGYFCPNCGSTYTAKSKVKIESDNDSVELYSAITCYKCTCGEYAVEIDIELLDAVSRLNKLGFKTEFCCSGHSFGDMAYIAFDGNVEFDIPLPDHWWHEKADDSFDCDAIRSIYLDEEDRNEYNNDFELYKNVYLVCLDKWIKALEAAEDGY